MGNMKVVAVLAAVALSLAGRCFGDEFNLVGTKTSADDEQYVEFQFSEPLRAGQNLNGLVRIAPGRCATRIEGPLLKVFPQPRLVGPATVTLDPGLQNERGARLGKSIERSVVFEGRKPQARFGRVGVILPATGTVRIPFEALNVRSVQVTAFRIFTADVGQFLQTNKLDGANELDRVGRYLWRKKIVLPDFAGEQWQRYDLDATELLKGGPGGLYRLTVSINRGDSTYACPEGGRQAPTDELPKSHDDLYMKENSSWDYADDEVGPSGRRKRADRDDPCKDDYYRYAPGVSETRNFLASNIGLIAKLDPQGGLRVAATSIQTARPMAGVAVKVLNFQNQPIGAAVTDKDGFARLQLDAKPFYLEARKGADRGYLKMGDGNALPISHFEVGGERAAEGVKGFVFGERGVWRPGDDIHLTFMVEDKSGRLPADHPATLKLFNPRDQLVETLTNSHPLGGFYVFRLKTSEDAPTGTWHAKVLVGNREFLKEVRVETVMPNRLKVELDLGSEVLVSSRPLQARLFSQWLHGAKASRLKAEVSLRLVAAPAKFDRFADFAWEDPTREFKSRDPKAIYQGELDEEGRGSFAFTVEPETPPPGVLTAQFETRVFEPGGAFSSIQKAALLHPFASYVGLKLPKGDRARNMLLTNKTHAVSIASLDAAGRPVSLSRVRVSLYKIGWRWWWEKGQGAQAEFASGIGTSPLREDTVSTRDGRGEWSFEVKYPEWGRYLVRACDEEGGHCSGQVFYIDWPGWAGHAQEQAGPAANLLTLSSDKTSYLVGETAVITLPEAGPGRALLSLETGSRILEQRWIPASKQKTQVRVPITAEMSPTVYASVSLIQPQRDKKNDRPIRLYGVLGFSVKNPDTVLAPRIQTAEEWRPSGVVPVTVSEEKGRAMTYMLMVVDEGLLGLTGFATPDPHAHFYMKEALGVATWDVFDYVIGAYGARLERLLALGGSEAGAQARRNAAPRRFPPVVRVLGPFELKEGQSLTHEVELPAYVGALRVMVVAGRRGAYGSAEKEVPVRQPVMVQATLPRVIGPEEEMTVPVTAFVMKEGITDVEASFAADGLFALAGPRQQRLRFRKPGEELALFTVRSGSRLGQGALTASARAGQETAVEETHLTVRSPNPPTTEHIDLVVEPHALARARIEPRGMPGTNRVVLEASVLPSFNLESRLDWLIQYPHGCAEQTTSSVFPQLSLPKLMKLPEDKRASVDENIKAAIERLKLFQTPVGGFDYWEGSQHPNEWVTNYVGHFLMEAQRAGYSVPSAMRSQWLDWQRTRAQNWEPGGPDSALMQAYRLYTLALAGKPELGAMNRLREGAMGSVARWQLAAAYELAGVRDAAEDLSRSADLSVENRRLGECLNTAMRDEAIILDAIALRREFARGRGLAETLAGRLSSKEWFGTHELSFALTAMSDYYGASSGDARVQYQYAVGNARDVQASSDKPMDRRQLEQFPDGGAEVRVFNPMDRRLFVTVSIHGVPKAGLEQTFAHGLNVSVEYQDELGLLLNVAELKQGTEVISVVRVRNDTHGDLENVALTQMPPSGWEIHTPRWGKAEDSQPAGLDFQDVRDDRIHSYFSVKSGETKTIRNRFTAAYLGRFYLPAVYAEAMYEGTQNGAVAGSWVRVSAK